MPAVLAPAPCRGYANGSVANDEEETVVVRVRFLAGLCGVLAAFAAQGAAASAAPAGSISVIYCTDLYHPHDDPDDHFDLLTLFALPEFNIRAIVIDTGERGQGRPGVPALKQAMHLTGRSVAYTTGLVRNLKGREDPGMDQPREAQAGVELILKALRESERPVTVFTTGSLRDVAAAFNRDEMLFRDKVHRVYVNAGHSGGKREWNVDMDPRAYVRLLRSGLPIYWVPCFGEKGYASFWKFKQGDVLTVSPKAVQNFFLYALTKADPAQRDPVKALAEEVPPGVFQELCQQERHMWCTGAFLDAARRPHPSFTFDQVAVEVHDDGTTRLGQGDGTVKLRTFRVLLPETYAADMTKVLKQLYGALGAGHK